MRGSTSVRRLKRRVYSVAIDHGSSATPKLLRSPILVLGGPNSQIDHIFRLITLSKLSQRTFGRVRITSSPSRDLLIVILFSPKNNLEENQLKKSMVVSNCDLGSHEESIIRDVFIANMQDGEIQRELLKETRSSKKALEVAIKIEMGTQNQLKISGTSAQSTSNQRVNMSINIVQNFLKEVKTPTNNIFKPTICLNCGFGWSESHRQN